jgi:hypothetical protein
LARGLRGAWRAPTFQSRATVAGAAYEVMGQISCG